MTRRVESSVLVCGTAQKTMVNVFLTIDTETYPRTSDWRRARLAREIAVDIHGITSLGEYGIRYQSEMLNRSGLRATFFVEALFASAVGLNPLEQIVDTIQSYGHEVQLHIQPEWLACVTRSVVPERRGDYMTSYSEAEQAAIIAEGLGNLRQCGARHVCAFRAGDFAANFATIRALETNSIAFDTSYNVCYLNRTCQLVGDRLHLQPTRFGKVYEFPVTFFRDWPGHQRHMQLSACSTGELENALLQAHRQGYYSCVIVSHSFELIRRGWRRNRAPAPDCVAIRRFDKLCDFLESNNDKFRMATFAEIDPEDIPHTYNVRPLTSTIFRTALRYTEQLGRRLRR